MNASEVYPDVLGDAVSYSSQRLAQLGSLVTAAGTMEVRRRAQTSALKAARGEHGLRVLREQERAARRAARVRWAPAYDARWLAQADLLQVAGVWVRPRCTPMLIRRLLLRCVRARSGCGGCIPTLWRGMTGCAVKGAGR